MYQHLYFEDATTQATDDIASQRVIKVFAADYDPLVWSQKTDLYHIMVADQEFSSAELFQIKPEVEFVGTQLERELIPLALDYSTKCKVRALLRFALDLKLFPYEIKLLSQNSDGTEIASLISANQAEPIRVELSGKPYVCLEISHPDALKILEERVIDNSDQMLTQELGAQMRERCERSCRSLERCV